MRAFIAKCASGDLLSGFETGVGSNARSNSVWFTPRERRPEHGRGVGIWFAHPPAHFAMLGAAMLAVAVGDNINPPPDDPDPVPLVGRSGVPSTHHERPDGVACRFQRIVNPVISASAEPRDVLKADPTGSHFAHQPHGLEEQSGALAVDAFALGVRRAGVLAGRASDDGVDGAESGQSVNCEGPNVIEHHHARPVVRKHRAPPWVGLARGDRRPAGAMQPERPAAGRAAEEVEAPHPAFPKKARSHADCTCPTCRHARCSALGMHGSTAEPLR